MLRYNYVLCIMYHVLFVICIYIPISCIAFGIKYYYYYYNYLEPLLKLKYQEMVHFGRKLTCSHSPNTFLLCMPQKIQDLGLYTQLNPFPL